MPKPTDLSVEHVDPITHSSVCGLKNSFNEVVATVSYNARKQNRFVPYKVNTHPAPTTFGDIAEFLVENSWVVCEFGGAEWWNESSRLGCGVNSGNDFERTPETRKMLSERAKAWNKTPAAAAARLKGGSQPWWVNSEGKTCRGENPGVGWKRGRKWNC